MLVPKPAIWIALIMIASPVFGDEPAKSSEVTEAARTAAIAKSLAQANVAQRKVEEFRLREGRFPISTEEAGLVPSTPGEAGPLASLTVVADGRVELTLGPASGVDGGRIVLTPALSTSTDPRNIQWRCQSPSYPSIADASNGRCEYVKTP